MNRGMRRSRLLVGGVALLAAATLAAGCSTPQEAAETGEGGEKSLTMATGSTGGTYFPLGGELAGQWSKNVDGVQVTTQESGASVENLKLLRQGEVDLIMAINGTSSKAAEGQGEGFEGSPVEGIVSLGNIYPEVYQMVATQKSGIKTFEDLKGKNVAIGPPGSGTAATFPVVAEAYGLDPEKDIKPFQDAFGEAAAKLKDGQVDAAFGALAMPAGSIDEIATSTPVHVVEISGEPMKELLEGDPTFSEIDVPEGTYGDSAASKTLTNWATLYAKEDLDETTACNITKVMYENAGEMSHSAAKQIKLETANEGLGAIKLHAGAEKYINTKSCG